ncbi:MAG: hypothetical protein ACE366_16845 [Bradymonadia bacterium]
MLNLDSAMKALEGEPWVHDLKVGGGNIPSLRIGTSITMIDGHQVDVWLKFYEPGPLLTDLRGINSLLEGLRPHSPEPLYAAAKERVEWHHREIEFDEDYAGGDYYRRSTSKTPEALQIEVYWFAHRLAELLLVGYEAASDSKEMA